jgi:hypothetical protein
MYTFKLLMGCSKGNKIQTRNAFLNKKVNFGVGGHQLEGNITMGFGAQRLDHYATPCPI